MIAVPSAVTLLGVLFGFLALLWAPERPYAACVAVVLASVCDMIDGRVARMTGTTSPFGAELDSLADVISFGIAPAMVIYLWGLAAPDAGRVFDPWVLVAFAFVVCGAIRLARFNLTASEGGVVDRFEGLPIPSGALYLCGFVMLSLEWDLDFLAARQWAVPIVLIAAALMVSKVPFPSFKKFKTRWGMVLFYGNIAAGLIELAFGLPGGTHLFALVNVYIFVGLRRGVLNLRGESAA